ncbi:MAG: 23S rRNA (adenine(2503)-C(2))-methyltransferase RlmN [Pirellulaceae bacterium]|nr:23S rRNA (adenine(2503)-C(2))-methyltransferase RlmN [Pirellulaceae bacterium]
MSTSSMSSSLPVLTPEMAQSALPYLIDRPAMDEFRRIHKLDPMRIRRTRFALFQQYLEPTDALEFLQAPYADAARKAFRLSALSIEERHDSALDRSSKFVLATETGDKIETVLMRSAKRITACVSTQVGCQAGCSFCATARMGLRRQLSAAEIVEQVLVAARTARAEGARVRNIVFMGMGEPLHNEQNLHEAIAHLSSRDGCNFPIRRISVSTVGEPAAMIRLVDRFPGIQVALSLHSARPELRARLVPWTRQIDWEQLHLAVREVATRPLTFHHQGPIMIQHIMIAGINDTEEDADALIEYVRGFECIVNLIPFNAIAPIQAWQPTSREHRDWFAKRLRAAGVYTTVRYSMGSDVAAACGQLVQ